MIIISQNKVLLLNNKYIIKLSKKNRLLSEKFFIERYENILPVEKIIKENIKNNYIIYSYIKGSKLNYKYNIKTLVHEIYSLTNKYKFINSNGYGEIFNLKKTWEEFLREEIKAKSEYITIDKPQKTKKVLEQLEIIKSFKITPKLIHGDLGSFNLIFNNNNSKIIGIVDPRTIVGDSLYDFVYFIFSNYNITKNLNLHKVILFLNSNGENIKKIFALMYILLYDRISIETKNNTNHINNFYFIWNELECIEKILVN